ncbi:unnamed protein product [Nezara viridula]|uniref:Uncharacterized protein n=1 Tax=Nezara viridula TaxID=85310 RepID=A0A9P0E8U2_NEZVI|nr:unnamed protein product [Nezara viridula]
MAAKKRRGNTDAVTPGVDMLEETTSVLLSVGDSLPETKTILSSKPHISCEKKNNIEESLKELRTYVKSITENILTYDTEDQEKNAKVMFAITTYLKTILDFKDYSHSVNFRAIINSAVYFLIDHPTNTIDAKLKNHIALLSLRFMELTDFDENEVYIGSITLIYFLDLTLANIEGEKGVRKVDIKHVWSMHKFLEGINLLDPTHKNLVDKLMLTVSNQNYIKFKEGHNIIGHLMSRNVAFVKKIHDIILNFAPKLNKQVASGYGDAYFIAWTMAKEDNIREEIESSIQDIMLKVIKISRGTLDLPKAGASGLSILSVLHQSRRLKKFSDVINRLYTPILWRALKSNDPWERCNAAQVFLDVFPLEIPYLSEPDNANYMDRQIKEIQDLLLDESHFVRVITIKGVCAHLTKSLELFSVTHVRAIMKVLLEDLANDGSTYLVRKAVFEGLEMMVNGSPGTAEEPNMGSAAVLEPLLPLMYLSIHDENEKVRKAVVKLLLKIKEKSANIRLRYWEVVPLKHLVVRLAHEGPVVGELIVKLIMSEFYTRGQGTDKTINRLIRLMSWNLTAIKKLFHYSKAILSVEQAFLIIITIIGIIRKKLREHLDTECDVENENKKESTTRKKKRKGSLEDISNRTLEKEKSSEGETSSSSSSPPERTPHEINADFLENHRFIAGLINGATVLWVSFRNEIGQNEKYLDNLYSLACNAVPLFLKHYKGTCVYYATVSFASLIPISKLKGVSTVSSACISELKEITDTTDVSKVQCLIYSLCSWYRGHDVLDLASEWLNYAFREQNLNNSAMPVKTGQKPAKVRFLQTEGKPMLSLKLLDVLFSDVLNETRIVCKHYEQLYDFYLFLERIVVIIERKVLGGENFKPETQLTDEFLLKAYTRYLRLMHTLHRPEPPPEVNDSVPPFSSITTSLQAIDWASNVLYKHIPSDGGTGSPPLVASCCLSVLKEATIGIALGNTDQNHCKSVALFASDLLSFDCVWFIEEVIHTIKVLTDYSLDETPNDDWLLIKNMIPCLLEKSLKVMSMLEVTPSSAKLHFKDLTAMKHALFTFPKTLISLYGVKHPQFDDAFRMYINACVQIVMQEIYKEDELIRCKTFDEQPYFVSLILKYIIVVPSLMKHLLPAILFYMNLYHEEGYKLLGCLSLMFTVVHASKTRLDGLELEVVLQEAYKILSSYKEKEKTKASEGEDSNFSTSSINIDVIKVGETLLEELSSHLHCSLIKPLSASATPVVQIGTPIRSTPVVENVTPVTTRSDSTSSRSSSNSLSGKRVKPVDQLNSKSASKLSTIPTSKLSTPASKSSTMKSDDGVFLVPLAPVSASKSRSTLSKSSLMSENNSTSSSKAPSTPNSSDYSLNVDSIFTPSPKHILASINNMNSTPSSKSVSTPSSKSVSTPSSKSVSTPSSRCTPVLKANSNKNKIETKKNSAGS